jgi:hypothetical protein
MMLTLYCILMGKLQNNIKGPLNRGPFFLPHFFIFLRIYSFFRRRRLNMSEGHPMFVICTLIPVLFLYIPIVISRTSLVFYGYSLLVRVGTVKNGKIVPWERKKPCGCPNRNVHNIYR